MNLTTTISLCDYYINSMNRKAKQIKLEAEHYQKMAAIYQKIKNKAIKAKKHSSVKWEIDEAKPILLKLVVEE